MEVGNPNPITKDMEPPNPKTPLPSAASNQPPPRTAATPNNRYSGFLVSGSLRTFYFGHSFFVTAATVCSDSIDGKVPEVRAT